MYTVKSYHAPSETETPAYKLADFNDSEIEKAKKRAERKYGPLGDDPRTGFPSFVILEDGVEVGGG